MVTYQKSILIVFVLLAAQSLMAGEDSIMHTKFFLQNHHQAAAADTNLAFVNRWAYGPNYACFVDTPYAFIGNGGVLQILNVSQSRAPTLAGELRTPGVIQGIFVKGGYAFVATTASVSTNHPGLRIINVSNPASPAEVSSIAFGTISLSGVYADGNYVYVANRSAGLRILNISNPAFPSLVGTYDTPGSAISVVVSGTYAYVADGSGGLRIINVSNPSAPTEVGFYDTPGVSRWVTIQGQYAYVADGLFGLRVVNVANPANPVEVGFFDTEGEALGVAITDNMACVADNWNGLRLVNISNPAAPFGVSTLPTFTHPQIGSGAARVCAVGTTVFVSDWFNGLHIINASNASSPFELAYVPTQSWSYDIKVEGTKAYLINGARGLIEMDVSDPVNPREVRSLHPANWGYAQSVEITDNYLIVSCGFGGVRFVSKSTFTEVGSYVPGTYIYNAELSPDARYLFVPARSNGFKIVEVQNVSSPAVIGEYPAPAGSEFFDVVVSDSKAYLSDFKGRYFILDLTNLTRPVLLGTIQTSQTGGNYIALSFPYLYAADGDGGLQILDVSNASNITVVKTIAPGSFGWRVQLVENLLYYCDSRYGLLVYDVSSPADPVLVGSFDTIFQAQSTAVLGNYVYVADGAGGLVILRAAFLTSVSVKKSLNPSAFSLSQNYPNPFNPITNFEFQIGKIGLVTLKIYDLLGREVATLVNEPLTPGSYTVTWDARGLPSGVFSCRLQFGSFVETRKLVMLR